MGLETVTNISDLNAANPTGSDSPSDGDNHIRNIKTALKTDLVNITGPVTATQTELNLLDGQEGAVLLKGVSTGGGTADAITADFTPNVSLTDGVTVIVRAQGANTVTNPTFAPDGLTAKTIVKGDNESLTIGDIAGSSHELILKYNSTNDNWSLLNALGSGRHRGALANLSGSQSIPDSTDTAISLDDEVYDTDSIHDVSVNSSRLTVPANVTKVKVCGKLDTGTISAGYVIVSITKNGITYPGYSRLVEWAPSAAGANVFMLSTTVIEVTAGDYFELEVYQTSGSAISASGDTVGTQTWLSMEIIE